LIVGADKADWDVRPLGDLPTRTGEYGPSRIVSDGESGDVDDDRERFIQRRFDDGVSQWDVCSAVQHAVEDEKTSIRRGSGFDA
jgi:hypothetical protein